MTGATMSEPKTITLEYLNEERERYSKYEDERLLDDLRKLSGRCAAKAEGMDCITAEQATDYKYLIGIIIDEVEKRMCSPYRSFHHRKREENNELDVSTDRQ